MSILSVPYFHNEAAAVAKLEEVLWGDEPVCPHCGGAGKSYRIQGKRPGLRKCGHCRKQYTVKVGTVFKSSHIPLHKWLQAVYLMTSSKKGISAHQLHRVLEITYKSAWFMAHRIRETMRTDDLDAFGTDGGIFEVDETFIGHGREKKPKGEKRGRGYAHKHKVLSLIDRERGRARSMVIDSLKAADMEPILKANVAKEAKLMTDEAGYYGEPGRSFKAHELVRHNSGEYGRGEFQTNKIEGYFSIFKRGMKGVYQHCAKKHLHRYAAEFEFRYNNRSANGVEEAEHVALALMRAAGRRLIYKSACRYA